MTRSCDIIYQNVKICEAAVLKAKSVTKVNVRRKPGRNPSDGLLQIDNRVIECKLGRNGIRSFKFEGDNATPVGNFRVLCGYFRGDRIILHRRNLKFRNTHPLDGWCDDAKSPNYNKPVKLPFSTSHEKMRREDRLYDVCLILDYNIHPVIRNKGSAIFFHQTSEERKPTAGCIAIDPDKMRKLLPFLSSNTRIRVFP